VSDALQVLPAAPEVRRAVGFEVRHLNRKFPDLLPAVFRLTLPRGRGARAHMAGHGINQVRLGHASRTQCASHASSEGTWEHGNIHGNGGGAAPGKWLGPGERDASTKDSRTACLERLALVRS
jgi:hypothetical protein